MRPSDVALFDSLFALYRKRGMSDEDIEEQLHAMARNFRDTRLVDDPSTLDVARYLRGKGITPTHL